MSDRAGAVPVVADRHESALGHWTISRAAPPRDLGDVISGIWEVDGRTAHARERVLPHGGVGLLFNLGPEQALVRGGGAARETFRSAWVAGLQSTYLTTESLAESRLVALRLTPLGAARVLGVPMDALAESVTALDGVLGARVLALRERLGEARGASERFTLLLAWVRGRLARAKPIAPELAHAALELAATAGQKRIAELRRELGWSERHFAAQFRRSVGATPKSYARILRFNAALAALSSASSPDLTTLAQRCGYYDQAHLSRDFRAFAGASPSEFLRVRIPNAGAPGFSRES